MGAREQLRIWDGPIKNKPLALWEAFCAGYEIGVSGLPCEDWGTVTLDLIELIEVWKAGWRVGRMDYEDTGMPGEQET